MPESTLPAHFWAKVNRTDGCWFWTGAKVSSGYGNFKFQGRYCVAHRLSYVDTYGQIPDGLVLDHLCRERSCVNPSHLEPVTHRVNILRGVGFSAKEVVQTHCKEGHEFTEENTYRWHGQPNQRKCRKCRRAAFIRHKERFPS